MLITGCLLVVVNGDICRLIALSQCNLPVNRKIGLMLINIKEQYRAVYEEITS